MFQFQPKSCPNIDLREAPLALQRVYAIILRNDIIEKLTILETFFPNFPAIYISMLIMRPIIGKKKFGITLPLWHNITKYYEYVICIHICIMFKGPTHFHLNITQDVYINIVYFYLLDC